MVIASQLKLIISDAFDLASADPSDAALASEKQLLLAYLFKNGITLNGIAHRALLHLLKQTYGNDEELVKSNLTRLRRLCNLFIELYGDGPVMLMRVPARINILGEHIDYVSYIPTASLPFGSREHDMVMLYRSSETRRARGASTFEHYAPFSFELDEGPRDASAVNLERAWLGYIQGQPAPPPHWANYIKASLFYALMKYGESIDRGLDFIVDSTIPPGGGASSSSALVVLAGAAIRTVNHIAYDFRELADESSQAEWYVGTRGGAMDHLTMCLAERQLAAHISYAGGQVDLVPLPDQHFCWVTFFSHPANKGREVMLEYNERAAVSRIIIPAIIENWRIHRPESFAAWQTALDEFEAGSDSVLDCLREALAQLPETISLTQLAQDYPGAFGQCSLSFPALVRERREHPMKVRDRALHHLGEVSRVATAVTVLRDISLAAEDLKRRIVAAGMRTIGELLDESHESLCRLYEVCTPEVEQLTNVIVSDPNVYGAHLMGGGFGGNVLALTTRERLSSIIASVQSEFYEPRGRDGLREDSVMVSTPGQGLSTIDIESVWREAIVQFNTRWWEADSYREAIGSMLDDLIFAKPAVEVRPIIVAAGLGSRAALSGLDVPKPLAQVSGLPAIRRLLQVVRVATQSLLPPLVVVSPEIELQVRDALLGEDIEIIIQPIARGSGDAVLCAYEPMRGFHGRALVVWGTQPVISVKTIRRSLALAETFIDYRMVLPTALTREPYAPVQRDHRGQVTRAQETHLEKARAPRFGETNVGLFILKSEAMFEALLEMKRDYWREAEGRYDRPGGELGFPNELITHFARITNGVLASPIADRREAQGIKTREDVARCEQFISELERE
jgi:galactokinase/CTP:molybdopterin cytidylyltransferase MocA